jgi:hypothetical protein
MTGMSVVLLMLPQYTECWYQTVDDSCVVEAVCSCEPWTLRFFKRVIALWLASKLLTTKGAVRLDLDSLGTVGSVLG